MTDISEPENKETALSPTVKRLGLVSFLADFSSEMLYPITPIFLTTVLGASASSLGFIEGVAESLASLLKTYSGFWSDKIQKRKTFIWMGYLLAALAKPITGASQTWVQVLWARGLDRTGKGLRTAPRDALLAESVPVHLRGQAFGWHRMMDTLGAAVGPLLAVVFLNYSTDVRLIYYLAFIPGILAVLVALSLKETQQQRPLVQLPNQKWNQFSTLPKNFKYYLFCWMLFSLANSSDVFLLLRTQQMGLSLTQAILLYCFYNLTYALASPYLGGLSDKWGRKKVLLFGFLVFACVYGAFSFATALSHFWFLFGVYGLYMAATDGVGKAFAIDLVDDNLKATAVGFVGTVTGLSTLVASSLAGVLWDALGPAATFVYGMTGALAAAIALAFLAVNAGDKTV